jgi:hypothetical protein
MFNFLSFQNGRFRMPEDKKKNALQVILQFSHCSCGCSHYYEDVDQLNHSKHALSKVCTLLECGCSHDWSLQLGHLNHLDRGEYNKAYLKLSRLVEALEPNTKMRARRRRGETCPFFHLRNFENHSVASFATCSSVPGSSKRCVALGTIVSSFVARNFSRASLFNSITSRSLSPTIRSVGA